jgi:hypothetical protein
MDACRRKGFPDTNQTCRSNGAIAQLARRRRTDTIATGVRVDQRSVSSRRTIFDNVEYDDLEEVYLTCQMNAEENKSSLSIFDDVQLFFKQKEIQKLLLHIINTLENYVKQGE